MKIERFCTCGAVLRATVERRKRQQALIAWYDWHSGEGHADTTGEGAEAARMGEGKTCPTTSQEPR